MSEQSMVERVRRAVQAVDPANIGFKTGDAIARAAIAAMREPNKAIIEAHHVVPDDTNFRERIIDNWHGLIDAALKED